MIFPLNVMHYYVGFIVVAFVTAELWKRSKSSGQVNPTLRNIAITCGISTGAMFLYGFPVLVTHDRDLLTYSTVAANCLQFIATIFLWFIITRASLGTKPVVQKTVNGIVILITIFFIIASIFKDTVYPYGTYVVQNGDSISLISKGYAPLALLSGLNSFALIFMGFFFRNQAKAAPKRSQRLRIKSFAFAFFAAGTALVVQPIVGDIDSKNLGQYLFIIGFIVVVLAGVASFVINSRASKKTR